MIMIELYRLVLEGIIMSNNYLKPLFKYPGGKSSEYKYLKKLFPDFNTYIEPFIGGGAVYWATDANNWIINDYSRELISIYKYCKDQNEVFIKYFEEISTIWTRKNKYEKFIEYALKNNIRCTKEQLLELSIDLGSDIKYLPMNFELLTNYFEDSLNRKIKSLNKISQKTIIKNWKDNALGILGSGIYTYLRYLYNHTSFEKKPELKTILYLFIREYSYSSMFRFNSEGLFNVPFGGNSYAKKDFSKRLKQFKDPNVISKLQETRILQGDFSNAFLDEQNAFMFLDPPYDTEFSTYNLHVFDANEQIRLHDELLKINKTKWLMVTKSTAFIEKLYNRKGWFKKHFDKTYSVNFKNRNDKNVSHLVISNYNLEE